MDSYGFQVVQDFVHPQYVAPHSTPTLCSLPAKDIMGCITGICFSLIEPKSCWFPVGFPFNRTPGKGDTSKRHLDMSHHATYFSLTRPGLAPWQAMRCLREADGSRKGRASCAIRLRLRSTVCVTSHVPFLGVRNINCRLFRLSCRTDMAIHNPQNTPHDLT